MHTNTTAVLDAEAPTSPLALHARATFLRRDLAATLRLGPVRREMVADAGAPPDQLRAAREAAADRRSTRDRVLDRVVDRLMQELSL